MEERKRIIPSMKRLNEWIRNPISIALIATTFFLFVVCMILAVTCLANKLSSSSKQVISQGSVSQNDDTLDLTFETLTAIANVVGKKHKIEYKQIEYLNEPNNYSAGLYSLDTDVVRLKFYSSSPTSKAKSIDMIINCSEITGDNIEIFSDMLDWVLKMIDEKAYLDGSSKIWKELSSDYKSNGELGSYETDKLYFSYTVINGDIVVSIYPL